eukprot:11135116-Lingulodinium_polyedra.AAC.1
MEGAPHGVPNIRFARPKPVREPRRGHAVDGAQTGGANRNVNGDGRMHREPTVVINAEATTKRS